MIGRLKFHEAVCTEEIEADTTWSGDKVGERSAALKAAYNLETRLNRLIARFRTSLNYSNDWHSKWSKTFFFFFGVLGFPETWPDNWLMESA